MKSKRTIPVFAAALVIMFGCNVVTIHGRVLVKGSEPHTYTVINSDDGEDVKIIGPLEPVLKQNQHRRVTVKGTIVSEKIGPGMPATMEVTEIVSVTDR